MNHLRFRIVRGSLRSGHGTSRDIGGRKYLAAVRQCELKRGHSTFADRAIVFEPLG